MRPRRSFGPLWITTKNKNRVRFKLEVDQSIAKIESEPMQPRLRRNCYRRVNLSVFRHYIAYVIRGDLVWIVAICHAHLRPEFWMQHVTGR